jgi:hypothetical protein
MNSKLHKLTKSPAQSVTRHAVLKKLRLSFVGAALACSGFTDVALAQTSVVCDAAGDAVRGNGQGSGTGVPLWLDIRQSVVAADSLGNILFTLTVNAPIPTVPAWSGLDDGGQLTWGWRLVSSPSDLTFVRDGCLGGNGSALPACYYLDLVWSVQTSTFRARLLDNTSCTEVAVAFVLSADRTQVTLVVAKSLLANRTLIPDPDNFQHLAATVAWSSDSMGNSSFHHLDWAPDQNNGQLVMCTWSASSNSTCSCP